MQAAVFLVASFLFVVFSVTTSTAWGSGQPHESQSSKQALPVDAPSLHLHVILLRDKIHGQSAFEVFAAPVVSEDNTSVRYDGFAEFIQGDTEFTYLLVDGAAYAVETKGNDTTSAAIQEAHCLSSITPYDSIIQPLNNAVATSETSIVTEAFGCTGENSFKTYFQGKRFTLCALSSTGFMAYGGSMYVFVDYLESPLRSIRAPTLTDATVPCPTVTTSTFLTPTALKFLTGDGTASTKDAQD